MTAASSNCLQVSRQVYEFVADEEKSNLCGSLCSLIQSVYDLAQEFFKKLQSVAKYLAWTGLAAFYALPFSVNNALSGLIKCFKTKDPNKLIDGSLNIVTDTGDVVDSVAGIASTLGQFGILTTQAVAWAGPLSIVGTVFSIFNFVSSGRTLWFTGKLLHKLNKDNDEKALTKVIETSKYTLKSKLNVDFKEFTTVLKDCPKKETLIQKLKERIHRELFSTSLDILNRKVSLVAMAMMLFSVIFPVVAPILVPIGIALTIGTIVTRIFTQLWGLYSDKRLAIEISQVKLAAN